MGRFFGLIHRHSQHLPCLLREAGDTLLLPEGYELAGWGLGYHASNRVFLQKEPVVGKAETDVMGIARQARATDLLCHVHRPLDRGWTPEDAQPFACQGWVLAHLGRVHGFRTDRALRMALQEHILPFLRRNIRGRSDSELLLHLLLSRLHERVRLPAAGVEGEVVARVMVAFVGEVERLQAEHGPPDEPPQLTLGLTNGEILVTSAVGQPLYWRHVDRLEACPVCSVPPDDPSRPPHQLDHEDLGATWFASGLGLDGEAPDERWYPVPDRTVVWADRSGGLYGLPIDDPDAQAVPFGLKGCRE